MGDVNYTEMTDEELMNVDDSGFQSIQDTDDSAPVVDLDLAKEPEEKPEVVEPDEENSEDEEIKSQDQSENKDELETEEPTTEDKVQDSPDEKDETVEEDTDFRAETLAPLKANGKELKLNSVEELRNLASMGANYSLKMQKLKPHLKLLKTLEKYDLLDEDKVNYLISLTKGDKGAISKLLADSDIDPAYMDLPESDTYKADDYTIPDSELALDEVLDNIKTSEHYSTTMEILGNVWDEQSRSTIAANPQSVQTIHDHVVNGMYSKIWGEVERQRMLGNLTSQTDVQAYDIVGEAMQEQGMFNPTAESSSDSVRKAKRKAAGSTKNLGKGKGTKAKSKTEFDIFSMSDEEIEALSIPGIT